MKTLLLVSILLSSIYLSNAGTCRYATITLDAENGTSTNSLHLLDGETGEILTFAGSGTYYTLSLTKDGMLFPAYARTSPSGTYAAGTVVSGPADISIVATSGKALMTVQITPSAYDPNKTLIIPPGTNQVQVILEASTNLVSWVPATNGIYGSPDTARFFRIKTDTPRTP